MSRDEEAHPIRGARKGAHAIRTAAVVIYGTLLATCFTIPQSLVNWLRDMDENPVQQAVLHGAEAMQAVSHRIGADVPYLRARAAFYALTGKVDD
jgi:hypothetical protein